MKTIDLVAWQGADFTYRLPLFADQARTTPFPRAGWSVRAQLRRSELSAPLVELTTANGRAALVEQSLNIDTDPEAETITVLTLVMPAALTATLPAGVWVYDVELVHSGGAVLRPIGGSFSVAPEVTR